MQTIVITGATGGIGRALCLEYASSKSSHLILLARREHELKALVTECKALGAKTDYFAVDLQSTAQVLSLMSELDQKYQIDLLISNAGVTSSSDNERIESWESITQLLDVNLVGALAVAHPVLKGMQQRQSGHVAYVSSLAAYYGMSLTPAYSASKAGLKAYAEAMRVLLKPSSVNVTLITPGFVETPMSDKFNGSKPFMLTPQQAAKKIKHGLDRQAKVITFPLVLSVGMRILSCLPASIADRILALLRY
ncbi:SDR family NAD(P)-dependent oxidoreductase [Leucothrix sargassi]|nr:SDR family NAD(P)-dependent oxidoreductase [Leucothrix sargassi]